MSAIGLGQYVVIEMWNGDELVHSGVLPPRESATLRFVEGAIPVERFTISRNQVRGGSLPCLCTGGSRVTCVPPSVDELEAAVMNDDLRFALVPLGREKGEAITEAIRALAGRARGYEEALDEIQRIEMDDAAELVDEIRNIALAALGVTG